ncbi:MAG: flagellar export chaperone FliS [Rhodanobacter sp.]
MTYGYMRNASAIYQQNSAHGRVENADAHQLVGMLLDGAVERIIQARGHMTHGDVPAKGSCIARAVAIIGELRASLDPKMAPAFSARLGSLYEYVTRRLLAGQLHDEPAALDEAIKLLVPVRDGWKAIRSEYLAGASRSAKTA